MEGDEDVDVNTANKMMPVGGAWAANHTDCVKLACAALPSRTSEAEPSKDEQKTLNPDPLNILAEETALRECQKGYVVQQELMETEMVVESCGCLIQGTPDGGFIDSDGLLRLVQVVRVPLLPDMGADDVGHTLYDTVLTKIVKSQSWMKETHKLPHDFVIFCWLPRVGAYHECLKQTDALLWTEALIWNVRSGGWPFSLRVQVPDDDVILFPENFGLRNERRVKKNFFDQLCYFLNPLSFHEPDDDEEPLEWYLFEEDESLAVPTTAVNVDWVAVAIQIIEDRVHTEKVAFEHLLAVLGIEAYRLALKFCFFLIQQSLLESRLASPYIEPPLPPLIRGLKWLGLGGREERGGEGGRRWDAKPCGSHVQV